MLALKKKKTEKMEVKIDDYKILNRKDWSGIFILTVHDTLFSVINT